jgi:hypothetical protein
VQQTATSAVETRSGYTRRGCPARGIVLRKVRQGAAALSAALQNTANCCISLAERDAVAAALPIRLG